MKSLRHTSLSLLLVATTGLISCSKESTNPATSPEANAQASTQSQNQHYRPTATFQEIMDSVVDFSADYLWQSFRTVSDEKGTHEYQPRTDAEWHEVRRRAVLLAESANLIAIPGRKVAHGDRTAETNDPLDVAAIQKRLDADHEQLVSFGDALRDISLQMVAAADKKDIDGMMRLGGTLDEVCEACHVKFWYPETKY